LKTAEVFKVATKVQQPVQQAFRGNPDRTSPPIGPAAGLRPPYQGDFRGGPMRTVFGSQAQDRKPQQSIRGINIRRTDSELSLPAFPIAL
jgi:hypothetical protein